MEQLCEHRTQGIKNRKASGLSGGAGGKTGVFIRNTMEIRRASKKAGVHRKKQKLLSDTRKQEVLWEKLVELKETPGKDGETPEKRGEPIFLPD